jgi:DNA processing protein
MLAAPEPPAAQANVVCDSPLPDPKDAIEGIAGAVGIGNPIGDACEAVTDPILGLPGKALDPLKDAAGSIGKGVFNQVTAWVADGAVWLIGEVAVLSERTTSPNLLSKGFLRQYRLMALLASFMAALMLIFCVFEALGRGDPMMLWRVFLINVPLAAIATSAAYVVVQLLIATCDGMCVAISQSAGADSKEFFEGAIKALAEAGASPGAVAGAAGAPGPGPASSEAAGAVAVPLFVGFIAAIVAAFAAFFVWIELLMRDAAIYVVALFMPMALAASIWPRWSSALMRTCELLVVIIFSKFVIVAIVSLAASLLAKNEGAVEHVLAAGSMLLLACFAPFVLFKLVPFAEGAVSSAFSRQSASGGAMRSVEFANSMMMVHQLSQRNWAAASAHEGAHGSSGGTGQTGGKGGAASGAGGAAEGGAGAGAVPLAAVSEVGKAGKQAGERAAGSGEAQAIETSAGSSASGQGAKPTTGGQEGAARPSAGKRETGSASESSAGSEGGKTPAAPQSAAETPEPQEAGGGGSPGAAKPPRPASDGETAGRDEGNR